MKKLTLLTAVALSCCSYTPILAQVQILRSGVPHIAPRLVSDQTALDDLSPLSSATDSSLDSVAKEAIPNPFDYFAEELPTVDAAASADDSSRRSSTEEESLFGDNLSDNSLDSRQSDSNQPSTQSADAEDSASIPVGRHHRRNPSVVDTIVSQAALGNIPHCATTPVYWGGSQHTPNPVAEWLLREQCVEGLWASYPQQRAAECAQMWAHLAGHSCGGCGTGNCGQTVSGPCSVCAEPRMRHNRYTGLFSAAPKSCAPCSAPSNSCSSAAAPCTSCSDTSGPAAPGCADCAQSVDRSAASGQLVKTGIDNVAQLPSLQSFR